MSKTYGVTVIYEGWLEVEADNPSEAERIAEGIVCTNLRGTNLSLMNFHFEVDSEGDEEECDYEEEDEDW